VEDFLKTRDNTSQIAFNPKPTGTVEVIGGFAL